MIEEGDIIEIDIPNYALNITASADELSERRKKWVPQEQTVKGGYLSRYAKLATSADRGAILL